ncbi:MAG: PaaI family thioesterase [Actinobacteria bacterium]|nr:PaaI family thioesterase [Actinomycetota bacterium]
MMMHDAAGDYATLTLLPAGSDVLTLEYELDFLQPAVGEPLVAEGAVLRAGRYVSVMRVDVHVEADGQRSLCAALQQSIMRVSRAQEAS